MTFTTPAFFLFLGITFGLYWAMPRRRQNLLILAASLLFYGWWDWRFLFLLFFNAGVDYVAALRMSATDQPRARKFWLLVSLVSNLGVLGFFKYFNFFSESFATLAQALGMTANPVLLRVILPVGISFFTFQALSYTIDVYRRQMHPVRDLVAYFGFICFFPHMVAGPIQRATHLLIQFERERTWDEARAADGARQMLWGFFKKLVIADHLAQTVNTVYGNADGSSGWSLLLATYLFAFQIYCDFSGYTDIAIGCARLFGFDMTRNFAYPYFSRSIPEFWRRWHISLSTWFREYLYIPLGGNRVAPWRRNLNVMAVFLASGLWHGANWTFLVWGFLHGLFFILPFWREHQGTATSLAATRLTSAVSPSLTHEQPQTAKPRRKVESLPGGAGALPSLCSLGAMLLTFHLACFAWIFFRAASLSEAMLIIRKIAAAPFSGYGEVKGMGDLLLVAILITIEWCGRAHAHPLSVGTWPRPARWALYYATVLVILLRVQTAETPFIYFQF